MLQRFTPCLAQYPVYYYPILNINILLNFANVSRNNHITIPSFLYNTMMLLHDHSPVVHCGLCMLPFYNLAASYHPYNIILLPSISHEASIQ